MEYYTQQSYNYPPNCSHNFSDTHQPMTYTHPSHTYSHNHSTNYSHNFPDTQHTYTHSPNTYSHNHPTDFSHSFIDTQPTYIQPSNTYPYRKQKRNKQPRHRCGYCRTIGHTFYSCQIRFQDENYTREQRKYEQEQLSQQNFNNDLTYTETYPSSRRYTNVKKLKRNLNKQNQKENYYHLQNELNTQNIANFSNELKPSHEFNLYELIQQQLTDLSNSPQIVTNDTNIQAQYSSNLTAHHSIQDKSNSTFYDNSNPTKIHDTGTSKHPSNKHKTNHNRVQKYETNNSPNIATQPEILTQPIKQIQITSYRSQNQGNETGSNQS